MENNLSTVVSPGDNLVSRRTPFDLGCVRHIGSAYRYDVVCVDPANKRLHLAGNVIFTIPDSEWALVEDWMTDSEDGIVITRNTELGGWYRLRNVRTGFSIQGIAVDNPD